MKTLYIFADNDVNGAGFAAAFECAHKNIMYKNDVETVIIRWREIHGDFNDIVQEGGKVLQMRVGK